MPSLRIVNGPNEGTLIPIGEGVTIGRAPTCDLVLASPSVLREHARVVRVEEGFVIEDRGSRCGTYVNHLWITCVRTALKDGDQIRIGDFLIDFLDDPAI